MKRTYHKVTLAVVAVFCSGMALASDSVIGEAVLFKSPNGVEERCVRIAEMPGAKYSKHDKKTEASYCSIDLYSADVGLCPKTWSTSPGMIIHDLSSGHYKGNRAGFERHACPEGKSAKSLSAGDLAKFKTTMNAKGTSGTFSTSSLLYYHFSRYFEADIGVPVAVWRSMDRKQHHSEVARPGLAQSGHSHSSRMNHTAWQVFSDADARPSSYRPTSELFTADEKAIYGALLQSPGGRYSSEINGTRKSGWGKGQNNDFQKTAPFYALRSNKPLGGAVTEGLTRARKDPQIRRDMGKDISSQQMVFWMTELANIVLLDFIFSQQDRVGNIDYRNSWYWIENGKLKHRKAQHHGPEPEPVPEGAIRLKRTHLNDNDAGGKLAYANFTKSTKMLEKLRHFPAVTYSKLLELDQDLQRQGQLHAYISNSFGLSERQRDQIVKNTSLALGILSQTCQRDELSFDLEPEEFFLSGSVQPREVRCSISE